MYAQHSYRPGGGRPVSLVAALAVNGVMILGLATFAPKILTVKHPETVVTTIPIPVDPPTPEPVNVKQKTLPTELHPTTTATVVKTPVQPVIVTPVIPDAPLNVGPAAPLGDKFVAEPPAPPLVFHAAETDPRFAGAFQPLYPSEEIRLGREGRVVVRVLIGADGRVHEVQQVSATSAAFFEATKRQALGRWRFKPAIRGASPEESWKTMTVSFVLQNGD